MVGDMRPLAIEDIVWKNYEMVIDGDLMEYLIENDIIDINQYAGKLGSCSEDCLFDLTINMDEELRMILVRLITFDSSQAFDSQFILIIEDKLKYHCGMNDEAILKCTSTILLRYSITKVNNTFSNKVLH